VTVENIPRAELAKVWGINECLQWAMEDESPVPRAALDYWQSCRQNGNVQIWEVLSALEANWGLSFSIRESRGQETPTSAPRTESPRLSPPPSNGKPAAPAIYTLNDLIGLMTRRYQDLLQQRKEIDAELAAMAQIMPKPKRKYTRRNGRALES
jgi:hypothetical protein